MSLSDFLPQRPWGGVDYFLAIIMFVLVAIAAGLIFLLLAWIFKAIMYEYSYAEVKSYPGEVVDMKYVPPRTRTIYNTATKTMQTSTDPEKNIVIIKTELRTTQLNSSKLYQRVRIGESVVVKSQAEYSKPKYWQGNWEYEGDRLISITSEKNQSVLFNEEKPATYKNRNW